MKKNILAILNNLRNNTEKINDNELQAFTQSIIQAKHIFLSGAGRSGIMIRAFANRLMHLGFDVSVVGEITSPHSKSGDLLIICSGSGETGNLKQLSTKALNNGVDVSIITTNRESSIAKSATTVLVLAGGSKEDFSQPMGTEFEQLALLVFDSIVLTLMDELNENSETMRARHADFE